MNTMNRSRDYSQMLVYPHSSLRDIMTSIDRSTEGAALIVDNERHLIGVVTDGDVRRAILAGVDLSEPADQLLVRKASLGSSYSSPITAPKGTGHAQLLHVMQEEGIRHIPILDDEQRVVDVASLRNLIEEEETPMTAVVMAGGFGTRLRPLTENLPKPMIQMGDRPLLERIIGQLRDSGIRRVNVTTHYKPDVIGDHFGDGSNFGVKLDYVEEDQPLGTAGALGLLARTDGPLLVMNGDILTRVDFRAMLDFHREHGAELTVGVRQYDFRLPYGVIESDGVQVKSLSEKPVLSYFINTGIYLLDPAVVECVPKETRYDMTDLIEKLLSEGRRVVSFPIHEYWLDIGEIQNYEQALADIESGQL